MPERVPDGMPRGILRGRVPAVGNTPRYCRRGPASLALAALLVVSLTHEPDAHGRAAPAAAATMGQTRVLSYPLEQVWPATIRHLRVDRGYAILDRDAEAGFILFEIPVSNARTDAPTVRGSFQVFATKDASGRPSTRVEVATDGGALHLPNALLDGLAAKLRTEHGPPAAPPSKPPDSDKKPKAKPKDPPPPEDGPPEGLAPDDSDLVIDPGLDP